MSAQCRPQVGISFANRWRWYRIVPMRHRVRCEGQGHRRKPELRSDAGDLAIGIDLGGSKILAAVIDRQGQVLSADRSTTPASKGHEAVIRSIVASANSALEGASVSPSQWIAVGVGAPGLVNPETGIVATSPHLPGWCDISLRDLIQERLGKRTFLINDANAAAIGELCFGAARNARNFIYITLSTGIGGGIVIDGKVYSGAIGAAGEVGHMTIYDDGPQCNCGNRGCWEALASGTALAREARQRIGEGACTSILKCAGGQGEKITAEAVHRAAKQGDGLARELIERTGYYVGVGLANLINIFNPELIVIGGGLSNIGDMLFEPALRVAGERAYQAAFRAVRFAPAELGANSGVIGAAAHARREIESDGD
jgi:glucokinase